MGMFLVGIGSCLFHTTLRFEMQLMDELPTQLTKSIPLVEMKGPPRYGAKLAAGLIVYCMAITAVYLAILNPVFHQVAYGIEMLTILGRCIHLIRGVPEGPYKQGLTKLVWYSTVTFLAGFFLWNVDNVFCPQLRSARDYVNFPLEVVLQLHGWWHILTCMGCTGFILLTQALRIYYLGKHHKYRIRYFKGVIPYLQHCLESKD
ncbi:alkaline ceramidase ydc1 [Dimargaris xerosporica]|nr:alkaline ceramidase ydc1 [Dimargaris xerosporica]